MAKLTKRILTADKLTLLPIILSVLTTFLVSVALIYFYPKLPPLLPLFYSLPWGEDQLVPKQQFFLLPLLISLITILNFTLAFYLHQIHLILKRLLMLNLILICLILAITAIKVILIFV